MAVDLWSAMLTLFLIMDPLGNLPIVVAILKDLKPEIYKQHTEQYIKDHTFEYYDEYPLTLMLEKLDTYFQEYKN